MLENKANSSEMEDEHAATEWPEIKINRNRNKRKKTMRVKTFLLLFFLIIFSYIGIFGYLFYQAKMIMNGGRPSDLASAPSYLYTIYEGKNKFLYPMATTVNSDGKIYVTNNGIHTVEVIQRNGIPESFFGGSGNGQGQMLYPYGIGVLPNGNILVSETGNSRIQEYNPDGSFYRTFASNFGKFGLKKPGPLVVDSQGNVYIGDLARNSVVLLDSQGKHIRTIGNIDYPHGIALNEISRTLYVSDSGEGKIKVFSLTQNSDTPIKEISYWQPKTRFSMVRGLATDSFGRLYVCDTISSSIRVFDSNGEYLFSFGEQGVEDGNFLYPVGIYIDNSGKIYITDYGNNRVQVWGY